MQRRTIKKSPKPSLLYQLFGIYRDHVQWFLLCGELVLLPIAIVNGNKDVVKLCMFMGIAYILFSIADYVE